MQSSKMNIANKLWFVIAIHAAICIVVDSPNPYRKDNCFPCFCTLHRGEKRANCTKPTLNNNGFTDLDNVPLILENITGSVNIILLHDLPIVTLTKETFSRSNGNKIEQLKKLEIINCGIKAIEPDAFNQTYLWNVEKLILSKNRLTDLKENTFTGLYQLKYLYFEENQLTTLNESSIFAGLSELREIFLNSNELYYLADNLFATNTKLQTIDLSNNRLKTITSAFLNNIVRLKNIIVNGNPWNCTAIEDVMGQIFQSNLYDTKSFCGTPEEFNRKSWFDYFQNKLASKSDETRNNYPIHDTSVPIQISTNNTLLAVIIVILLVFGFGGSVYLWHSNRKKTKNPKPEECKKTEENAAFIVVGSECSVQVEEN